MKPATRVAVWISSVAIAAVLALSCRDTPPITAPGILPPLPVRYAYNVTNPCARVVGTDEPGVAKCVGEEVVFAGGVAITRQAGDSIFGTFTDEAGEFSIAGLVRGGRMTFSISGRVLRYENDGVITGANVRGDALIWFSGIRQAIYPFAMIRVSP